jgi:hypothetical protein
MKTKVEAVRLQFNESDKPEIVLTCQTSRHLAQKGVAELKEMILSKKVLECEIKQHRERRSLNANAFLWKLCQEIAEIIRSTKEEVYKKAIREVGQFEILAIQEKAVQQFIKIWNSRGLGWYAEEMDSKLSGCKKIVAYYGSSCYDSKAMSVLLDFIIDDAKELNIEVLTPEEVASLKQQYNQE